MLCCISPTALKQYFKNWLLMHDNQKNVTFDLDISNHHIVNVDSEWENLNSIHESG